MTARHLTCAEALPGARLALLPSVIDGLARDLPGLTTVTFSVMAGTDFVDGRSARRTGQARAFGAIFDSAVLRTGDHALFAVLAVAIAVDRIPKWHS